MEKLKTSVQYLKGVGPKRYKLLNRLGIETIEDLIYFLPKSYEDRRELKKIMSLKDGEKTSVKVIIENDPYVYKPKRNISITRVLVKDDTGMAQLIWFNQDYIVKSLKKGEIIKVNGKVKKSGKIIEIHNPVYVKEGEESDKIGQILPIYSLTEKLKNNDLIKIMDTALYEYLEYVDDKLPEYIIEKFNLPNLQDSLRNIHFPKDRSHYIKSRKRLAFEELFTLQLGLLLIKNKYNIKKDYIEYPQTLELESFIQDLPFELTNAQTKVFKEICNDMESPKQMNRLVQGDVGSGKTIIAVLAMYKAFKGGYQSVMMAPTEILATQHYESISSVFKGYGIKCELLISSISKKKKKEIIERVKNGETHILIGTHALIEDYVEFKSLGLAVTDEQHRFGVRQRAKLSSKGESPDILVMTATPIPRTLALILYGDLDISIIDELPPGRKQIKTYVRNNSSKYKIYDFIKTQIKEGRQAYVVCPLVEESETLNIKSATELYDELKENEFKDFNIELLHGKMKSSDKDEIMMRFKNGDVDILISTTVIEVGVNVPNASIMMIENAERFGLAQLHQLRGRIGRGEYQSYCILINDSNSKVARQRMDIMEKTNDGFIISEKDLEIRGPGEFFGTRQHGLPELKVAKLPSDIKILKVAQETCFEILKIDPNLEQKEHEGIKQKIKEMFDRENLIIFN